MALRAKQLLGLRPMPPREKLEATGILPALAEHAPQQNEGGGSWTIRALFRGAPRRDRRSSAGGARTLPRTLLSMVRPRRRPAHRGLQHAQQDGALPALQTAVSIQPIAEGGSPAAGSGDALDAFGAALARGRTPLARSHGRSSPANGRSPAARGRSPADVPPRSAAESPLPPPPDCLDVVMRELEAARAQVAKQAAMLEEVEGCCNAARRHVYEAAVQLAQCKERRERDERLLAEVDAAAQRDAQETEKRVAALQLELLSITSTAAAERRHLDAGALAAVRRAEGLDAAAASSQQAAATWKHRHTLMAASHQPLSAAERRRAAEEMDEWRNRGA